MVPHLRIRACTYRGNRGWLLCGGGLRIFDRDRAVIAAIKEAYRQLPKAQASERCGDLLMRRVQP